MSNDKPVRHKFKQISLANLGQPDEQTMLWTRTTAIAKDVFMLRVGRM